MKITRHSVFETNSSSSHSITFPETPSNPKNWETYLHPSEIIINGTGAYGWGYETYYDIYDKLDYLMIDIEFSVKDELKQSYYDKIQRVFVEYNLGMCKLIFDNSNVTGYIDHQSLGTGIEVLEKDDETLARYLFDKNVDLIIDNDNR